MLFSLWTFSVIVLLGALTYAIYPCTVRCPGITLTALAVQIKNVRKKYANWQRWICPYCYFLFSHSFEHLLALYSLLKCILHTYFYFIYYKFRSISYCSLIWFAIIFHLYLAYQTDLVANNIHRETTKKLLTC